MTRRVEQVAFDIDVLSGREGGHCLADGHLAELVAHSVAMKPTRIQTNACILSQNGNSADIGCSHRYRTVGNCSAVRTLYDLCRTNYKTRVAQCKGWVLTVLKRILGVIESH